MWIISGGQGIGGLEVKRDEVEVDLGDLGGVV